MPTFKRKDSQKDIKYHLKYQKNVVTIEDDLGMVSNQFIDETKFKSILSTLKTISKNVKKVVFIDNTFVCNPIEVLKQFVTEKAHFVIILESTQNKLLSKTVFTRRDMELLKNVGVEVI